MALTDKESKFFDALEADKKKAYEDAKYNALQAHLNHNDPATYEKYTKDTNTAIIKMNTLEEVLQMFKGYLFG